MAYQKLQARRAAAVVPSNTANIVACGRILLHSIGRY